MWTWIFLNRVKIRLSKCMFTGGEDDWILKIQFNDVLDCVLYK